jgi:hypothetical protein
VAKKTGEKKNRKMRGKILLSNRATDTISPYSNRGNPILYDAKME